MPREDPSGQTLVLRAADFLRIKNAARVTSEEERRAAAERLKEEKERELVTYFDLIFLSLGFNYHPEIYFSLFV